MDNGRTRRTPVFAETLREILVREVPDLTIENIAMIVGVGPKTVWRILHPEAADASALMKYTTVDKFLTRLGLAHLWHIDPGLIEVNEWLDSLPTREELKKKYQQEYAAVRRQRRQAKGDAQQCPNGHDRSPENVAYRESGAIYCRACNREAARAKYAADSKHREKKVLAQRARRAAEKVAA